VLLGRLFGWLLIALALLALGGDGLRWLESGDLQFIALGEVWRQFAPDSLEAVQTGVQRSLLPVVWDFGLAPILALPAVAVLGLLGLLFLAIFRKRAQKKRPRFGALS
jgi:hypothetical protein